MAETVTIPKDEYELLVKCRHIIESDFEEKFSKEFVEEVKKSEEEYNKGEFARFGNSEEAKKYLDSL
ncbi:hypothetical protein CMO83_03550 [Candidatus Woesearchaeota archaeon]|jgi:hypothetical protein|nr:hypothetical protein [Candidatus Woesearchaeota archaeon]